jgi:hypothetical protein
MLKLTFCTFKHRWYRKRLVALLGGALLMYGPLAWSEAAIVVVTGKSSQITQLSQEEVAELFLGKRKHSHDEAITPLDSDDSALRELFYLAVTEMDGMRIKAYWSRIVFSGQGRPPQEASITEASARLINEPGTLMYLPANQVTPEMKVVFSIP